jgi:hypothetical protein
MAYNRRMDERIGRLLNILHGCHWPGCNRAPDVSVDYEQTKPRDLRLALLPPYGGVNLCDRHAVELETAGARVLGITRLE